jgi:hypothetical protein
MAEINKKLDENAKAIKVGSFLSFINFFLLFADLLQSVKECQKLLYCKSIKCKVSFDFTKIMYSFGYSDDECRQNAVV